MFVLLLWAIQIPRAEKLNKIFGLLSAVYFRKIGIDKDCPCVSIAAEM